MIKKKIIKLKKIKKQKKRHQHLKIGTQRNLLEIRKLLY